MQRIGKNLDGYYGETIEIEAVLREIEVVALGQRWTGEMLPAGEGGVVQAWRRHGAVGRRRIYISAGIHGDEPAGPLAALRLLQANSWPDDADVWLCPCLNPTGFSRKTRVNAQGVDLNRQYLNTTAAETLAHIAWLERQPGFDVALCLHEDWESHGFYVYELNPDNLHSHAEEIIRRVSAVCPIDPSPVIEGRPAQGGIIRPSSDPGSRPEWPEAFWLLTHKTRRSYTLEAPSDFPLETRVASLVEGVRAVLEAG